MQLEKPLEALRLEDLLFSPVKYIAVVAIDFGTTYSGFAFAFNHKEGEAGIHMNKEWGSDQGCRTLKTPTCLLLKPDTSFDSFGYEAAERFAYFDDAEAKEYYFFERFKMFLHNSQDLNRNTMLEEKNGKSLKALDVFAHSICYLKDVALDIIRERIGDEEFSAVDVQWVLTVPAIWKPAAKQFMREAAYKAGLASADAPEQLLIALEPEAASVYCREKKMREFMTESERDNATVSDVLARPNIQYMVIDIGGGTLDVTAHELLTNGALKEIYKVTGGPWGGTKVDEEFHHFLEQIFGERLIYSYQQSYPADWLCLRNDFEMKKRGKRAFQGASTRIRLPRSFYNTLSSKFGSDLDSVVSRNYCPAELKLYGGEYLCLSPNIMKKLFEPVLSGIVSHLRTLLQNEELSGVKLLFLVGGFADSPLLQSAIKKEFESRYRVLIPQCASIAVMQGAVMFGQTPDTFESRIMSFTYGIKVSRLFLDGLHPEEKKIYVEGVPRCRDVFFTFVKAGEAVKVGQKKRISGFSPLYANQKEVKVDFYSSESRDVLFVTDEGVNMLPGGLVFKVTDEWKPQDIEINLYFGETEMKVTIVDINSGSSKTTYLDFLSKNL